MARSDQVSTATVSPVIAGSVAPGFESVRDAFAENFRGRDELGAAFAAYVDGEAVVDLWGGWADADRKRPWETDTVQIIFSGTKGLVATAVMLLVDRGQVDLEQPVASYWPEFGSSGKEAITVGQALSHRAGLPGLPPSVDIDDLLDDRAMAARLAKQRPLWDDRERVAYHGLTYGWIAGEIIRRITGRSVGRFFADEIAAPLKLDAWIGVPSDVEPRVGTLASHQTFQAKWRETAASGAGRILFQGLPIFADPLIWNRHDFHAAEFPGANGIADARSVARLYGVLASGGAAGTCSLASSSSVATCSAERSRGIDAVTGEHVAFGSGFQLQTPYATFGPTATAFGHGGAGGSIHGCWPDHRTGFSYVMNSLRPEIDDDRSRTLLGTLYTAVANRPS